MNALKKIAAILVLFVGPAFPCVGGAGDGTGFGSWVLTKHIQLGPAPPPGYSVSTSVVNDGADSWPLLALSCRNGEFQAVLFREKPKPDTFMISIDGKKPRTFNASIEEHYSGALEAKITTADLDWFADSQSSIRIALPAARREFVFSVKETRKAVAVLKEACKIP
jgi:hypothetical protein